jgi:hypothetical protein
MKRCSLPSKLPVTCFVAVSFWVVPVAAGHALQSGLGPMVVEVPPPALAPATELEPATFAVPPAPAALELPPLEAPALLALPAAPAALAPPAPALGEPPAPATLAVLPATLLAPAPALTAPAAPELTAPAAPALELLCPALPSSGASPSDSLPPQAAIKNGTMNQMRVLDVAIFTFVVKAVPA